MTKRGGNGTHYPACDVLSPTAAIFSSSWVVINRPEASRVDSARTFCDLSHRGKLNITNPQINGQCSTGGYRVCKNAIGRKVEIHIPARVLAPEPAIRTVLAQSPPKKSCARSSNVTLTTRGTLEAIPPRIAFRAALPRRHGRPRHGHRQRHRATNVLGVFSLTLGDLAMSRPIKTVTALAIAVGLSLATSTAASAFWRHGGRGGGSCGSNGGSWGGGGLFGGGSWGGGSGGGSCGSYGGNWSSGCGCGETQSSEPSCACSSSESSTTVQHQANYAPERAPEAPQMNSEDRRYGGGYSGQSSNADTEQNSDRSSRDSSSTGRVKDQPSDRDSSSSSRSQSLNQNDRQGMSSSSSDKQLP
jgi:hypothetical protein